MNKKERIGRMADQLISKGDLDSIAEFYTRGYTAHAEDRVYYGHDFLTGYARQIHKAIPDIRIRKIEILVQAGDSVSWQRALQGTHKADMMGIPPSGKKIKWNEMVVSRFEGDKIAEEWVVSELAGALLLKQAKSR